MPDIACPSCGAPAKLLQLRPVADQFCRECDYPLFWTRSTEFAESTPEESNGEGIRRLPGIAGLQDQASMSCPNKDCKEPNPVAEEFCVRCGTQLHPVTSVVIEALPESSFPRPLPPPPPPPEPVKPSPWPMVVLAVAIAISILIIVLAIF